MNAFLGACVVLNYVLAGECQNRSPPLGRLLPEGAMSFSPELNQIPAAYYQIRVDVEM